MAEIVIEDRSSAGHVLRGSRLADLPDELTVRELIGIRVRGEVERHNADPAGIFSGLVQPEDSMAYSDGFHLDRVRELDADRQLRAFDEATERGLVSFELDGEPLEGPEATIDVADADTLVVHLRRPIVAPAP